MVRDLQTQFPKRGDLVQCLENDYDRTANDSEGNKKAWKLSPGEVAQVEDVDEDGDFRLRNPSNVLSDWV